MIKKKGMQRDNANELGEEENVPARFPETGWRIMLDAD